MTRALLFFLILSLPLVGVSGDIYAHPQNKSKKKEKSKSLTEREQIALKERYFEATREKLKGNFETAAKYFSDCLKIHPEHAASKYELAGIFEYLGRDSDALRMSEEAARLEGENEWYQLLLANLYEKNGRFRDGAEVMERLVEMRPGKSDYYEKWANMLVNDGNLKGAIAVWEKLEDQTGPLREITEVKVNLYRKSGDLDKAIELTEGLIKLEPDDMVHYSTLADLYKSKGDREKVMELYGKISEMEPDNPFLHLSLAEFYEEEGDHTKAFSEIKIAFASQDLPIVSKVNILGVYMQLAAAGAEQRREARELAEILKDTHPKDARVHGIWGDLLYQEGDIVGARDAFRNAVNYDQDRFPDWNRLLLLESELRDWDAMIEESATAMDLFPNQPSFYLFNGVGLQRRKKYEEAIDALETGKSLVVDNNGLLEQFYSTLGDIYYQTGDFAASDRNYDNSLLINPNNITVLNNYSYYLSLRGEKLEKAEQMSKKTVDREPNSPSYLDTYGWILFVAGKYEEAEKYLKKAIESGGKNGVILEHYGDVLFKLNRQEEAKSYWQQAEEAGGGSDELEQKIREGKLPE